MNTLLALLYLVLSLFGLDPARAADALCRHTLLPGVCQLVPALEPGRNAKAPAPGRGFAGGTRQAAYSELRITAAITPDATETST